MTVVEFFSFLPFGKYAFYVWFSYLVTFVVVATLFARTRAIRVNILQQLRIKFMREK